MHNLPPDLPRLRTVETYLVLLLDEIRRAIAAAEQRESERRRGIAARPPAPDWMIEQSLNSHHTPPVYVHAGGCPMAGKRSKGVTREEAVRALSEGVDPCPHCRPDTDLGMLD